MACSGWTKPEHFAWSDAGADVAGSRCGRAVAGTSGGRAATEPSPVLLQAGHDQTLTAPPWIIVDRCDHCLSCHLSTKVGKCDGLDPNPWLGFKVLHLSLHLSLLSFSQPTVVLEHINPCDVLEVNQTQFNSIKFIVL